MPPIISLTDDQMQMIQQAAEPLQRADRARFLKRTAELLRSVEIGDGSVGCACRIAQGELLKPLRGD